MYGRKYPIWNKVQACIYGSSKDWGAVDTCQVNVKVGTSASNSHHLVEHVTTRRQSQHGDFTVFTFGIQRYDGENWSKHEVLHRMWMDNEDNTRVWYTEPHEITYRRERKEHEIQEAMT